MKPGFTLLTFVSLLLMSSLASAQQTSMPTDPESATLAAIFSTPASQDCADAKLPSNDPDPFEASLLCSGACSDAVCLGKQPGTVCKTQPGGQIYTCRRAVAYCSFDDCQCWTGPLP